MVDYDEERHLYSLNGVKIPGVTEILSPITADGYAKINPAVLEHAAAKGTLVHDWAMMYDFGCAEDVMPSEIVPYCQAYADFIRDYRPQWEMIEEIVYNDTAYYAGRLDRFGLIDGKPSVVDIKTISSPSARTHLSVCCQTKAYALAINKGDAKRYALYLKPDSTYRLFDCEEYEKEQEFSAFAIFNTLLNLNKTFNSIGRRKK